MPQNAQPQWMSEMQGFAPLVTGPQHQVNDFAGLPFGDHPFGQIAGALATDWLGKNFSMAPLGLSDQNAADVFRRRQFMEMQKLILARSAEIDRESHMQTARGIFGLMGQPFGAEQRRGASFFIDALTTATALQVIPMEIMDQMAGIRGSAGVMAGRMMMGGRYRIDPVTGLLGTSAQTTIEQSRQLFDELFRSGDLAEMQGLSAGQVGGLFEAMQARGMVATPRTRPSEAARRALDELDATAPEQLIAAARRTGVAMPTDLGDLSADDMDKLRLDPAVAQRMRSFDSAAIRRSIQDYIGAISAVRDIFGDAGRPNAPMSELLSQLERMSQGGTSRLQPGQLAGMVRMTREMANMTGITMDTALALQQHGANRAVALGLDPTLSIGSNQGAMAFGGAYRAMGLGATPAWGLFNSDQMQQMDLNLRVNAAASNQANRGAVAIRMAEQVGGFEAGSQAQAYVEALKAGQTQFRDPTTNQMRSVAMNEQEFRSMLVGARGAAAEGQTQGPQLGITQDLIGAMERQRFVNQQFIQENNLQNVVRRTQGDVQARPFVATQLRFTLQSQLQAQGVSRAVAQQFSSDSARDITDRIMDLSPEDFRNDDTRNRMISEFIGDALRGTAAGAEVQGLIDSGKLDSDSFMRLTANRFFGQVTTAMQNTRGLREVGSFVNLQSLVHPDVMAQEEALLLQGESRKMLSEALAPLSGRASPLRNVISALQTTPPEELNLPRLLGSALGMVSTDVVTQKLQPGMEGLQELLRHYETLQTRLAGADDPDTRRRAMVQLQEQRDIIKQTVSSIQETLVASGVSTDLALPGDVTQRATRLADTQRTYSERLRESIQELPEEDRMKALTALMKAPEGKEFGIVSREFGTAAEDVAGRLLSSDQALERFGPRAITMAQELQEQSQSLRELAAIYTGGDRGLLQAMAATGAFDPKDMNQETATRVFEQVNRITEQQRNLIQRVGRMNTQALGEEAKMPDIVKQRMGLEPDADVPAARREEYNEQLKELQAVRAAQQQEPTPEMARQIMGFTPEQAIPAERQEEYDALVQRLGTAQGLTSEQRRTTTSAREMEIAARRQAQISFNRTEAGMRIQDEIVVLEKDSDAVSHKIVEVLLAEKAGDISAAKADENIETLRGQARALEAQITTQRERLEAGAGERYEQLRAGAEQLSEMRETAEAEFDASDAGIAMAARIKKAGDETDTFDAQIEIMEGQLKVEKDEKLSDKLTGMRTKRIAAGKELDRAKEERKKAVEERFTEAAQAAASRGEDVAGMVPLSAEDTLKLKQLKFEYIRAERLAKKGGTPEARKAGRDELARLEGSEVADTPDRAAARAAAEKAYDESDEGKALQALRESVESAEPTATMDEGDLIDKQDDLSGVETLIRANIDETFNVPFGKPRVEHAKALGRLQRRRRELRKELGLGIHARTPERRAEAVKLEAAEKARDEAIDKSLGEADTDGVTLASLAKRQGTTIEALLSYRPGEARATQEAFMRQKVAMAKLDEMAAKLAEEENIPIPEAKQRVLESGQVQEDMKAYAQSIRDAQKPEAIARDFLAEYGIEEKAAVEDYTKAMGATLGSPGAVGTMKRLIKARKLLTAMAGGEDGDRMGLVVAIKKMTRDEIREKYKPQLEAAAGVTEDTPSEQREAMVDKQIERLRRSVALESKLGVSMRGHGGTSPSAAEMSEFVSGVAAADRREREGPSVTVNYPEKIDVHLTSGKMDLVAQTVSGEGPGELAGAEHLAADTA